MQTKQGKTPAGNRLQARMLRRLAWLAKRCWRYQARPAWHGTPPAPALPA